MSEPRVVFDGVWKKFRKGERHDSLRDLIPGVAKKLFGREQGDDLENSEFWAVRDVSFEVRPGEALGIIGPNGAGKSTTLKLLTRILRPTRGRCEVRGRVGALIEVAAGFHPDLTGRENVFLQGAIMGLRRQDISRRLDEIVDFSGVRDFIDTQVKRYSSGMNARLGFAIAAHLDPDVLLIDEVLSVGDMAFQQRCVERMSSFVDRGAAVVFVSHHLESVVRLCGDAVLLRGTCVTRGKAQEVVQHYLTQVAAGRLQDSLPDEFQILGQLLSGDNQATVVVPGVELVLDVVVRSSKEIPDTYVVGFFCERATDGLRVYDVNFEKARSRIAAGVQGEVSRFSISFRAGLLRGIYRLGVHLYDPSKAAFLARRHDVAEFAVAEDRSYAGVADLEADLR